MKTLNSYESTGYSKQLKVCGFAVCVLLLALCSSAEAQQTKKVPRIGFVSVSGDPKTPGRNIEAFRQGLRELGYEEGKNVFVEYRFTTTQPDRVPDLMAELMKLKIDVLVSSSSSAIRAAQPTSKQIPIVMVTAQDPVEQGLVESLARPGGNITGLARLMGDLSGKRLELFKEAVPEISRVGVLAATGFTRLKQYEPAARTLKILLQYCEIRAQNPDPDETFQAALKARVNALIIIGNTVTNRYRKQIVELALNSRLPSMCEATGWVEGGCLMSYSANDAESFTRAAWYVDKILKGSKPAELPIEQPTKFELVINLKTAKQIGLTIPPNVFGAG
jgi:putative tryptophan/tyrosine transport system substrate-binding protein